LPTVQLKEHEIEDVMSKFIAGALNVLVTTTIIESGSISPTANTIIINRADRSPGGPSTNQGRVAGAGEGLRCPACACGRGAHGHGAASGSGDPGAVRARCRLPHSRPGLETPGAGTARKQQSGHIGGVGIDLYTQMMEEAMAELRARSLPFEPDTQITMRASAFIRRITSTTPSLRAGRYKEISSVGDETQLRDLATNCATATACCPNPRPTCSKS